MTIRSWIEKAFRSGKPPAVELRLAVALLVAKGYLVYPQSRTSAGVWISVEPVQSLSSESPPLDIGAAIRKALCASNDNVKHPTDWDGVLRPILQAANLRSWNELQKCARYCNIEATSTAIKLLPTRNGGTSGPRKGYQALMEQTTELPLSCTDEELGVALLRTIELCC